MANYQQQGGWAPQQQNQEWGQQPQQQGGWAPQQPVQQVETFGYDDEIGGGSDYTLLEPGGQYQFIVTKVERSEFNGSPKMPPCKSVEVGLQVQGTDVYFTKKFFLLTSYKNDIFKFFMSIGEKPLDNGNIRMNWQGALGRSGYFVAKHREWNGDKYNDVKKFLKPEEVKLPWE